MAQITIRRPLSRILSSKTWQRRVSTGLVFTTLVLLAILMVVIPIGWMALTALKERTQIFAWPPQYWPNPVRWQNFSDVVTQIPFVRFAWNSLVISVWNIVGRLFSCTIVAFAFARNGLAPTCR